jgi:sugar phosphate isomerase/epimerase
MGLDLLTNSLPLAPTLAPVAAQTDLSPKQSFEAVSSFGFRFVQLSASQPGFRPRELDHSGRRDLLASLRRHELAISGVDLWIPISEFSNPERVDHAISAVSSTIRLAADLGRVPISLILPGDETIVGTVSEQAAHVGIELADHHLPIRTIEGIGLGIDPAAWLSQNLDPAAAALSNASQLVSARVCDLLTSGLRGPIGDPQEGRLNVLEYRVALASAGYSRAVVLDARQWRDVPQGLKQSKLDWERVE